MDNSIVKYSYEVHPKIPIKNVIPKEAIYRIKVLDLTKDQVLECLKCGNVYRIFDRDTLIQVTIYNIDTLHVNTYNAPEKVYIDPSKKTDVVEVIDLSTTEYISESIRESNTIDSLSESTTEYISGSTTEYISDSISESNTIDSLSESTTEYISGSISESNSESNFYRKKKRYN